MAVATDDFAGWVKSADIPPSRLTTELDALLQAVFRFRQQQGGDYYSTRLLSHFLLHCGTGLKVAQIARLLGISRPCASHQQNLTSKEVIRQAHHRMDGRPYGKLLPRYVGPIAAYLLAHPDASRADLLDFIERTFSVRVSRIALYKFLKKYGLQDLGNAPQAAAPPSAVNLAALQSPSDATAAAVGPAPEVTPIPELAPALLDKTEPLLAAASAAAESERSPGGSAATMAAEVLLPVLPAPPFSTDERNTPVPSF